VLYGTFYPEIHGLGRINIIGNRYSMSIVGWLE